MFFFTIPLLSPQNMIMKKVFKILTVSFLLVITVSCKKKIYGCMDEQATNYSSIATEDLDNCVYPEPPEVELYTSYVSVISQSGTDDPTTIVLENSLNLTIVWARQTEGAYIGVMDKALDLSKTVLFYSTPASHLSVHGGFFNSSNAKLYMDTGLGVLTDNFSNLPFEIRLYN
jgi:hypothetical protein